MNGQQHRRNRRLVKEPFSRRAISTYSETIARLTDEMLDGWRPGETRDMAEEMRRYMLQVTSTLLFGLDEPELALRLGDMIAEWVLMNDELGAGALVPNETFSKRYEELLAYAEQLEAEIMGMIRRRRESQEFGRDVLSILVRMHDEEGGLSDEELVGQAAVLFSAAHMTTAHSLCWTLFLLAEHPSVMQQLWDELRRDGQTAGQTAAATDAADDADAEGEGDAALSLLDRVIKESMRVLPASAYSQRINVEAVELGPYRLPRGTGIVFTPLVTHHLPETFPDPNRFLPDRWLTIKPSPYAYHPFGAGARMCIGGPLALVIMRVALAANSHPLPADRGRRGRRRAPTSNRPCFSRRTACRWSSTRPTANSRAYRSPATSTSWSTWSKWTAARPAATIPCHRAGRGRRHVNRRWVCGASSLMRAKM